jgi:hypothetical protein
MKNWVASRLALELRWRDWAYQNLRFRRGLPARPTESQAGTQESLFYQAILSEALSACHRERITHWVDVGCRNWGYLDGCLTALPALKLGIGVERDPGRIFWNGYYRGDYAQAAAERGRTASREVRFLASDFRHINSDLFLESEMSGQKSSRLITHFFPFVSEYPCKQWGLPPDYAHFHDLAEHTLTLLNSERGESSSRPTWISLHQGEWEAEIAREVWRGLNIGFTEKVLEPAKLPGKWPGRHPLHLLVGK